MAWAICEDCDSLVEANLVHNGVMLVGHYVHCGWGHQCSPDEIFETIGDARKVRWQRATGYVATEQDREGDG